MHIQKSTFVLFITLLGYTHSLLAQNKSTKYIGHSSAIPIAQTSYKTDATTGLLDSTYGWGWDENTKKWSLYFRALPKYNADGTMNTMTEQYTFGAGSGWINSTLNTYTYNMNKDILTQVTQNWDNGTNAWVNYYRYTSTYDNHHNVLTYMTESWDVSNNEWLKRMLLTKNYGSVILMNEVNQTWDTTAKKWVDGSITSYTYNSPAGMDSMLITYWDPIRNIWENSFLETFTYDANQLRTGVVGRLWRTSTSSWDNYWQMSFTYDANKNLLDQTNQDWMPSTSSWRNAWQEISSYDASNNRTGHLYRDWDINVNNWVNSDSSYSYYSKANNGVILPRKTVSAVNIYPNPASAAVTLSTNLQQTEVLCIYDVLGKVVYTGNIKPGQSEQTLDISAFNKGMYIIKMGEQSEKLIVK
ncbi:MAG: T9SS type A sorting domain-containing protein [Bacteroidetes bacterium]|nr:T9SS type A sorting domain-containing protein [Bacteroidota bacterium]